MTHRTDEQGKCEACEAWEHETGYGKICTHLPTDESVVSPTIPERVEEFKKEFWKLSGDSVTELDRKQDEYVQNMLTETDQQARENCIAIVKEYEKNIQKSHHELMGTTHEDCKHLLAYDMHSRLIAIKHILEALSNPPSQV